MASQEKVVAGGLSHSSKTGSDWFLSKFVSVDGSLLHLLKQYSKTITVRGHITRILIGEPNIPDQGKMKRKKTGRNRTVIQIKHNR
jgi:hypothetical protein